MSRLIGDFDPVDFSDDFYLITAKPRTYDMTDPESAFSLAAIRPRGDAWRNGASDELAGSVMGGFFDALGDSFGPVYRRFADLIDEYFCSSASETLDWWAIEYGLPDGCDPFAEVCEKVGAVGDSLPAYAVAIAAARGWSIRIEQEFIIASQDACYGPACYGAQIYGAQQGVLWRITVDLPNSPTYSEALSRQPLFGMQLYGDSFSCAADIESLRCFVRRVAPAHADLIFITQN